MKEKRPQSLMDAILKTIGKKSVLTNILKVLRSELTFVCKVGGSYTLVSEWLSCFI